MDIRNCSITGQRKAVTDMKLLFTRNYQTMRYGISNETRAYGIIVNTPYQPQLEIADPHIVQISWDTTDIDDNLMGKRILDAMKVTTNIDSLWMYLRDRRLEKPIREYLADSNGDAI